VWINRSSTCQWHFSFFSGCCSKCSKGCKSAKGPGMERATNLQSDSLQKATTMTTSKFSPFT